jgi:hypothetical protein
MQAQRAGGGGEGVSQVEADERMARELQRQMDLETAGGSHGWTQQVGFAEHWPGDKLPLGSMVGYREIKPVSFRGT